MNDSIQAALRKLRLPGVRQTLDVRLQEARSGNLDHAEFLELLVRANRLRERRLKVASFRHLRALEDFDWSFNKSIPRKRLYELATGRFIDEARDILLLGPPGTGKTFLCQAIGYEAIKAGYVVLYRSIFDLVRDFLHDEAVTGQRPPTARSRTGASSSATFPPLRRSSTASSTTPTSSRSPAAATAFGTRPAGMRLASRSDPGMVQVAGFEAPGDTRNCWWPS